MDSFKDVLEAAQSYCKAQMAEPTYNLYIDGLEPISFEDSSHITPLGAQRLHLQDRDGPLSRPAQRGLQDSAGL